MSNRKIIEIELNNFVSSLSKRHDVDEVKTEKILLELLKESMISRVIEPSAMWNHKDMSRVKRELKRFL